MMVGNMIRDVAELGMTLLVADEAGMSTVEYAIGTIGICR